ncbi:MAG: preprotein translocase subunit SecG [Bdellovibrionales bacterium]|jgi:preprotein translocase subunit SecG|nr:preprotein translocase subunit SecG [Bdellovibrionales bacterium]
MGPAKGKYIMLSSLMVFQAIVSVLLILLVLLQFGKGAEAGLMGGSSDSVMTSAQQGNIFSKITVVLAILFLGNSILLARIQSQRGSKSLLDSEAPVARPLNADKAVEAQEAAAAQKSKEPSTTTTTK